MSGLRMLQMGVHTHLITCRASIPVMLRTATSHGTRGLVVEMTDGTSQANAEFHRNVGFCYDLVKANVERITKGLAAELENLPVTAAGVTPGWLRSEKMLENFGVTAANWRDACVRTPGFAHLSYMERRWLGRGCRAGQLPDPHVDEDQAGRWHAGPGDTAASVTGALRAAGEQTRAIASAAKLTDISAPGGRFSDSGPDPCRRRRGSSSRCCTSMPATPGTCTSHGN